MGNLAIKSTIYEIADFLGRTRNIMQNGDVELSLMHLDKAMTAMEECLKFTNEAINKIDEIDSELTND